MQCPSVILYPAACGEVIITKMQGLFTKTFIIYPISVPRLIESKI